MTQHYKYFKKSTNYPAYQKFQYYKIVLKGKTIHKHLLKLCLRSYSLGGTVAKLCFMHLGMVSRYDHTQIQAVYNIRIQSQQEQISHICSSGSSKDGIDLPSFPPSSTL